MKPRYEIVLDPSELWTVWDNLRNEPAMIGMTIVAGISKSEAEDACYVLNEVEKRRLAREERKKVANT
ncbi:MAG: hypothetical protein CMH69_06170 [Nitratireductor sp.]|jgi:hypothetical protein|uniref:hypothetical protein n=1 Tax=Nitratireductor sp. B36 TaxID=2762059 RepID=UPI000C8CD670|nr:hypothetical protein [Nitratireductor sp. B36]MAS12871.1 hypothetical protein [Nitratireductor sp.]MCC5779619.1 hypothetical protein [Nitratireductor sp. B36]